MHAAQVPSTSQFYWNAAHIRNMPYAKLNQKEEMGRNGEQRHKGDVELTVGC